MNNQVYGFDPYYMPVDTHEFDNFFSDQDTRRDILIIINQMINLNQCEESLGPEEYMDWRDRIMVMVDALADQYTSRQLPEMVDIACHDANNNVAEEDPVYEANPIPNSGETRHLPAGSTNALSAENIKEGNIMVNFGSEFAEDRYHLKSKYNQWKTLPDGRKENPYTRQPINNARTYKATLELPLLEGGRRRRRRTRISKKRSKSIFN